MATDEQTASDNHRSGGSKGGSRKSPQDAIAMLKDEHRAVDKLFESFEATGPRALRTRRSLVDRMIAELSRHTFIEEQILYPAARNEISDARDEVAEAFEEHHVVKWLLEELRDLDPADETFKAKVTVMTEIVRHHVEEEEREFFPVLRAQFSKQRLLELGAELRQARQGAPTQPHPRLPADPAGTPPSALSTVIDRAREVVHSVRTAS
jgi:hemerythrin-like domain-containing protein